MLILLYRYKIFENKLKNTDEKFLLDMPEKFNEEWTDFNENYKYELVRVGNRSNGWLCRKNRWNFGKNI